MPLDQEKFPRYAMFRGFKCRVLEYIGHDKFVVLSKNDLEYVAYRSQLTFLKESSKEDEK